MVGLFPPNSKETFFRFVSADAFNILRPVSVLPVNATFEINGWAAMAAPTVFPVCTTSGLALQSTYLGDSPYPLIILTTPGGKPAWFMRSARYSAVRGVISDGCNLIRRGALDETRN